MSFNRCFINDNVQVYINKKAVKMSTDYVFVYNSNESSLEDSNDYSNEDSNSNSIKVLKTDTLPIRLLLTRKGFLFIKNETVMIPILPTPSKRIYKTSIGCLNDKFIDNSYDIIVELTGYKDVNPKLVVSKCYGMNSINDINNEVINGMIEDLINSQPVVNNVKDWFNMILTTCPTDMKYDKVINNDSFKEPITRRDIRMIYDIHASNEIDIINKIEEVFDDINDEVTITNDFTDIVNKIIKEVDKYNNNSKRKHKPNEKIELKIYKGTSTTVLKIKYSDLLKLDIAWSMLNFL